MPLYVRFWADCNSFHSNPRLQSHHFTYRHMFAFRIFFHERSEMFCFVHWVPDIWRFGKYLQYRMVDAWKEIEPKEKTESQNWQNVCELWMYFIIYYQIVFGSKQPDCIIAFIPFSFIQTHITLAIIWSATCHLLITFAAFPTIQRRPYRIERKRCADFRLFIFDMWKYSFGH